MNDKELDNYMKTVNPNFNSHIEKGTIEMSNEYYNLLEEKMARLINQNQELKKKYENSVSDYETTMFEKEQLNSLVNSCQEEIRQLKKQLEETDRKLFLTKNELDMRQKSIDNKLNQQQEFIKYLEDYLKLFDYMCIDEQADYDMIEEILQKYKSIIGDDK